MDFHSKNISILAAVLKGNPFADNMMTLFECAYVRMMGWGGGVGGKGGTCLFALYVY